MPLSVGSVIWVDTPPDIRIDRNGVRLVTRSGGLEITTRMSHTSFRLACVCGLRELNAWEDSGEDGVVALRGVG